MVTYLSEIVVFPVAALDSNISWEVIDDKHVKATLRAHGITTSGVFGFDDGGYVVSFYTDERENVGMDGKIDNVPWEIYLKNYQNNDGVMHPTVMQAVWHYDDADLLYFDGTQFKIEYNK